MKMEPGKYSFGAGDRFGQAGKAQLLAFQKASDAGLEITPVWNKSEREHHITKTSPADNRKAADQAIRAAGWKGSYFIDADHIDHSNVGRYLNSSDYFTIDISKHIDTPSENEAISRFIERNLEYTGSLSIPGITLPLEISKKNLKDTASKYLNAIAEAAKTYQVIKKSKGESCFVIEISMDEAESPQSPVEFFLILSMLAEQGIPVQTIAPRFMGRFYKGIDYSGDISAFAKGFEEFLLIIMYSIEAFGLPENLKLSLHSGSDKFSVYPVIRKLINSHNCGIHIKTAGTTWLEEVIGLALTGGESLDMVKSIYCEALNRIDELSQPYGRLININRENLPVASEVLRWDSRKYADTLRHIPGHPDYNPHFRQLMHIAYKVAAEYGSTFISALSNNAEIISEQLTENLFRRHICRLFDVKV